jgi:hypothetical protein
LSLEDSQEDKIKFPAHHLIKKAAKKYKFYTICDKKIQQKIPVSKNKIIFIEKKR